MDRPLYAVQNGWVSANEGDTWRDLEHTYRAAVPEWVGVAVYLRAESMTRIGMDLYSIDRELRRSAAAIVRPESVRKPRAQKQGGAAEVTPANFATPIGTDEGTLNLRGVEAGSLETWLEPAGLLLTALSSYPITALVNTVSLLHEAALLRAWVRRPLAVADRLSLAEGLEAHRLVEEALRGPNATQPDIETDIGKPRYGHRASKAEVRLGDGTWVSGRMIDIVTKHGDGTVSFIHVE